MVVSFRVCFVAFVVTAHIVVCELFDSGITLVFASVGATLGIRLGHFR